MISCRQACALMVPFAVVLVSACSDPCEALCAATYDRALNCNVFLHAGDRQTSIDICTTAVEKQGFSGDTCSAGLNLVQSETCAQFAAAQCPNIPANNQGPGCAGAGG